MMAVLCAGLSAGLGACAARDPYVATPATTTSGNWKIEKQTDRITGTPVPSAMLIINNASNTFADYAQPASMQLTCFDGKPMVRFAFEFKVGARSLRGIFEEMITPVLYVVPDRPEINKVVIRSLFEEPVFS